MTGEVWQGAPDDASCVLREACGLVGLDPRGAELIRSGTNAVYRLASAPVVVRVAPPTAGLAAVRRQVAVARWMADSDIPAIRALDFDALSVEQPVQVSGRYVTFWELARDGHDEAEVHGATAVYGSTAELGAVLRRLHACTVPVTLGLPELTPTARAVIALTRLTHLPAADHQFLTERCAELASAYGKLSFVLPAGVVHGDANVGNLLRDRTGRAVLSDLDSVGVGPREWDLVLTAMFCDLYGWHTEAEYQAFVAAYGFDLRDWDGYRVMREVRELLMVVWLAGKPTQDARTAAELRKRLESLRTGQGRGSWEPM